MSILNFKKANCKNCYKCLRNCPVKAIRFDDGQASIIEDECILCGKCMLVCPQNAKEVVNDVEKVKQRIAQGKKVVASIAPAFVSSFDVYDFSIMYKALQKLGFSYAEQTSLGAYFVTKEYEKIIDAKKQKVIISTCCPTAVKYIRTKEIECVKDLADVVSPMLAHGKMLKEKDKDATVVFIGPCISKKEEAEGSKDIDFVLTFDELKDWFTESGINLNEIEKDESIDILYKNKSLLYPSDNGVLNSFEKKSDDYHYVSVSGIDNIKSVLQDVKEGKLENYFIEMSACVGSCINGPCAVNQNDSVIKSNERLVKYASVNTKSSDVMTKAKLEHNYSVIIKTEVMPSESEIQKALNEMGKKSKADELNCGACGYYTCRDKAIAVCLGKAKKDMCMPYMKDRAESLSNHIFSHSPNGLIVLDEELKIRQINSSAKDVLRIATGEDVTGVDIFHYMNPADFVIAMNSGRTINSKNTFLPKSNTYAEMTVVYVKQHNLLFAILKDITKDTIYKEKLKNMNQSTLNTADEVIEKQMRVVQEIASLLGETAAETKIALTKLKKSLLESEKEDI